MLCFSDPMYYVQCCWVLIREQGEMKLGETIELIRVFSAREMNWTVFFS